MSDIYYTIAQEAEAQYKEKMSRFIAFARHVVSAEEAKLIIKQYQNKYHDARHVCWAYMIGKDREIWQLNDNGEPSGTAGKPILGQINKMELTDVLVVVVRYFGGIKLGTSGLINAYRTAAALVLEEAGKKELHAMKPLEIKFSYEAADRVLKILRNYEIEIRERIFDNECCIKMDVRENDFEEIRNLVSKACL